MPLVDDDPCSPSRVLLMIFALLASVAVGTASLAPPTVTVSSQKTLLSPQLHRGQIVTWFGIVTEDPEPRWMLSRCTNCRPGLDSHSDLLACSVTGIDEHGFALARRVRVFFVNQPPSPIVENGPILFRDGNGYHIDGSPLTQDPLCLFYSRAQFGDPPAAIRIGSKWHFKWPAPAGVSNLTGITTVRDIDFKTETISMRATANSPDSWFIDATVSGGGIIERESESDHSQPHLSGGVTWTVQHQSFARLWDYPLPPVPDIMNPNGRFISVAHSRIIPQITLIRIWHFGPFIVTGPSAVLPKARDVFLFLGVVLIVALAGRAVMIAIQMSAGIATMEPGTKRLLVSLEIGLAIIVALYSMWWVYR
jgi:hypothetical protein